MQNASFDFMDPVNQFIEIAPDCPLKQAIVPPKKSAKQSIATIECELLSKTPYACMRASPLTKTYGWGAHYNEEGKIAIYAVGSKDYLRLVEDESIRKFAALRSKREPVASFN